LRGRGEGEENPWEKGKEIKDKEGFSYRSEGKRRRGKGGLLPITSREGEEKKK